MELKLNGTHQILVHIDDGNDNDDDDDDVL
jgi:hypothetical protein